MDASARAWSQTRAKPPPRSPAITVSATQDAKQAAIAAAGEPGHHGLGDAGREAGGDRGVARSPPAGEHLEAGASRRRVSGGYACGYLFPPHLPRFSPVTVLRWLETAASAARVGSFAP